MSQHNLAGLALVLPPALLTLAGVILLIVAPFAWGAAAHVEIPDWMTTFSGIAFGLPAAAIGGLTLREVLRRTRERFEVGFLILSVCWLFLILAAVALFALAPRIAESATYDSLRDADGKINTTPGAFFAVTLIGALFGTATFGALAYLYAHAVERNPARFDKKPNEIDAIGRMLRREANSWDAKRDRR